MALVRWMPWSPDWRQAPWPAVATLLLTLSVAGCGGQATATVAATSVVAPSATIPSAALSPTAVAATATPQAPPASPTPPAATATPPLPSPTPLPPTATARPAPPTPVSPDAAAVARGKAIFTGSIGCGLCHTIDGLTNGDQGPNLTHIASQPYDSLPNDPAFLRRWIKNPQAIKPGTLMPNLGLSDQQITDLVAFLETQR